METEKNTQSNPIKYCITAYIDLLGFSTHIETSGDLRTPIGQFAIQRLKTLEEQFKFLEQEKNSELLDFKYERINDSLILTMDLNDFLLPELGETFKNLGLEEWFSLQKGKQKEFENKCIECIEPIKKFIGIICRTHQFIKDRERRSCFPGAKTIISTGLRASFKGLDAKEDYFSANFAFSNAYEASNLLKGKQFYIDNNIIKLLIYINQRIINNVLKLSCLDTAADYISPLENLYDNPKKWIEAPIHKVVLFKKEYFYREINPVPLTFLQYTEKLDEISQQSIDDATYLELRDNDIDGKIKNGEIFLSTLNDFDTMKAGMLP